MMPLRRCLAVVLALFSATSPALAQKDSPDVAAALARVREHVEALPNGAGAGTFTPQTDTAVRQAFPDQRIVIVRFRIYPVARVMPEGMQPSNVFAVDKGNKIERVKDVKALEAFFRGHLAPVKNAADAKAALAAWLALTPEFHQDGMFKFETLEKEFAGDASKVSGRAIVTQGGNGELRAEMAFDGRGKVASVEEKAAIRRGPRPICQATKLLDADPIVRRMAEEDLLILMGRSARDYLMEQRSRATPDLRDAIDRLWDRIDMNGW